VVLHGFTQTGRLFGRFGDLLGDSHTLVAVDLPGHGGSDAVRADLAETADLVSQSVRTTVGEEPCDLLGYSLGARVALHVVTGTDLAVRRVVLIGATGGIEDPTERQRRRLSDEALADELELSGDVDRFLDHWLGGPMFDRLSSLDADGRAERGRNTATGLASSLRLCGTGTQEPLWDRLSTLACPVLAMAGADDARFAAHAIRITGLAPHAVVSLLPGGGHAVHLSQPEQAWRIVDHWLSTAEPALI
jgi:2-succinyl-6-hydroxy-2,4-cyclohexadiene-1-carboxylate synthase